MPRNEYNEAIFPVLLLFHDGGHDLHDLNDLEVNIIGNLSSKSDLAHPTCPEMSIMKLCFQNCHFFMMEVMTSMTSMTWRSTNPKWLLVTFLNHFYALYAKKELSLSKSLVKMTQKRDF